MSLYDFNDDKTRMISLPHEKERHIRGCIPARTVFETRQSKRCSGSFHHAGGNLIQSEWVSKRGRAVLYSYIYVLEYLMYVCMYV